MSGPTTSPHNPNWMPRGKSVSKTNLNSRRWQRTSPRRIGLWQKTRRPLQTSAKSCLCSNVAWSRKARLDSPVHPMHGTTSPSSSDPSTPSSGSLLTRVFRTCDSIPKRVWTAKSSLPGMKQSRRRNANCSLAPAVSGHARRWSGYTTTYLRRLSWQRATLAESTVARQRQLSQPVPPAPYQRLRQLVAVRLPLKNAWPSKQNFGPQLSRLSLRKRRTAGWRNRLARDLPPLKPWTSSPRGPRRQRAGLSPAAR